MRKDPNDPKNQQGELLEDGNYKHRVFVTSREAAPHHVVNEYNGRAGAEKLIAEAHAEGLSAIPSKRFEHNRAFFQIAMFSYNLWRHLKAFANEDGETTLSLNTNETSRMQFLLLAAKANFHSGGQKSNTRRIFKSSRGWIICFSVWTICGPIVKFGRSHRLRRQEFLCGRASRIVSCKKFYMCLGSNGYRFLSMA